MYIKGAILVLRATEAFYALPPRSEHPKTAEENQEYSPTRCPLGEVDIGCEPSSTGGYQNARRNYERYLALARGAALAGNPVEAENYYQHAEHHFKLMSSNREAK